MNKLIMKIVTVVGVVSSILYDIFGFWPLIVVGLIAAYFEHRTLPGWLIGFAFWNYMVGGGFRTWVNAKWKRRQRKVV